MQMSLEMNHTEKQKRSSDRNTDQKPDQNSGRKKTDSGELNELFEKLPGRLSFYYKNLVTGECYAYHAEETMMAASVIKLFIMAAAFARIERGELREDQLLSMKKEDYVPSCGAIAYLHEGIQVTILDLITLMIIFSDNTATNVLIDQIGMETIQEEIRALGYQKTRLQRHMYDLEKSSRGIQNLITAEETADLLERMYRGTLVSRKASEKMTEILKNQQLNGKIPFYLQALEEEPEIAHKTGEDTGISHDVGIVYAKNPFLVCFCGNQTDTPAWERVMAEVSLELYQKEVWSNENTEN